MSAFYNDMAQTATEMLTEFGQPIVVSRTEIGVPDIQTGVVSQLTTSFNGVGVLLDYVYRAFGNALEVPTVVTKSTKRLLMTIAKDVHPKDNVQVDGVVYQVIVVKLLNPAGTKLMYDLQIEQ